MKKVCFILSGIAYSGAEVVLERYLENNNDIIPIIIVLFDNSKVIKILEKKYNNIINLDFKYNKFMYTLLLPLIIFRVSNKLDSILKEVKPDFVYVNNTREGMLCSQIIKKGKYNNLVHIHDMKEITKNPYAKLFITKSLNIYEKKLTVSQANKKSWNLDNMNVIYNGIIEKNFKYRKGNYKIETIGFIGSLTKRKGADKFIELIPSLLTQKNMKIVIAFRDFEKKIEIKLNKAIENLNEQQKHRITVMRDLSIEEVNDLYDSIDLLVVCSRYDSLPTVIMEAQSKGILVVGTAVGGIAEMLDNKILLFEKLDTVSMLKKINQICNMTSEEIERIRYNGYLYTKEKFVLENNRKLLNKYLME